jgi:hypothetical protein
MSARAACDVAGEFAFSAARERSGALQVSDSECTRCAEIRLGE